MIWIIAWASFVTGFACSDLLDSWLERREERRDEGEATQ